MNSNEHMISRPQRKCNICIILSVLVFVVLMWKAIWLMWALSTPSSDFIASMVGVIIAIIALGLPIMLSNIADNLKPYKNRLIARLFKEEPSYRQMLSLLPILTVSLLLFFYFDSEPANEKVALRNQIIATVVTGLCVYAICVMLHFVKRCAEYTINTDDVVFKRLNKKVMDLQQGNEDSGRRTAQNFGEQEPLIGAYTQLMVTMAEAGRYDQLVEAYKHMTASFMRAVNDSPKDDDRGRRIRKFMTKQYETFFCLWGLLYDRDFDTIFQISLEYEAMLKFFILGDYDRLQYEPWFFAYSRMATVLSEPMAQRTPYCREWPWMWYFDFLLDRDIALEHQRILDLYLLSAMQQVVANNNGEIFGAFVAHANDGVWRYWDIPENEEGVKKEKSEERIRNVQYIAATLGAYALFKKRWGFVKTLLFFNQPRESYVNQINRDISPRDLETILKWYKDSSLTQFAYVHLWDGHADGRYWFERYLCLLLCRDEVNWNYVTPQDYTKQDYEYDELCLKHLQEVMAKLREERVLVHCGLLPDNDAIVEMTNVINIIKEKIATIQQDSELDSQKIEAFKDRVIKDAKSRTLWSNVLQDLPATITNSYDVQVKIGDKRLIDKSFLSLNDNGWYVGFEHSFAEIIISQLDYRVERELWKKRRPNSGWTKDNYLEHIFGLNNDYIVVFINNLNSFNQILAKDPDFKWKHEDNLLGYTSDGTAIYSSGDPADQSSRVFILNKNSISKITRGEIRIDIEDLNHPKEETAQWIEKLSDEKRKELRRQALITINGSATFSLSNDPEVWFVDDI